MYQKFKGRLIIIDTSKTVTKYRNTDIKILRKKNMHSLLYYSIIMK